MFRFEQNNNAIDIYGDKIYLLAQKDHAITKLLKNICN